MTVTPARYLGKGVEKAVIAVDDEIGPELLGYDASEQRLDRPGDARPRRHAEQGPARRQRDPRRLAGGRQGCGRVGRPAAVPVRRRPERAPAAGADDERAQRRRPRRHRRRHPGVHDRADRCGHVRRVGALGCGGLPRAEGGAEGARARHRARRRGRVRAEPAEQPGGARPAARRDRAGRLRRRTRRRLALDVAATEFFADGAYRFEGEVALLRSG